jgi:hypothetical protein
MIVTDLLILGFIVFMMISFLVYCLASREPMKRKNLLKYFPMTQTTSTFKESDIVFFSSGTKYDIKDHILRLGGGSHLTHVGIIVEFCGIPYILESVRQGVRVRLAKKLENFLKKDKHNSLFIKRLFREPKPNERSALNHQLMIAVKKYIRRNYSYDFMPLYYKRVVNFLPLPIQQSEYIDSKHKSGFSCLSLVKTILINELESMKLKEMDSDTKSLQELFELSDIDVFSNRLRYSDALFYQSTKNQL